MRLRTFAAALMLVLSAADAAGAQRNTAEEGELLPRETGIALSSDQQRISSRTLTADVGPETDATWPTVRVAGTIQRRTACGPPAESAAEDEEYLIVTINGGSGVLLSFGCQEGMLRASSTGWVEGNRTFDGRSASGGGDSLDFDYRSYLIAGAASDGPDEVEVRLEADADYRVTVDRLEVGRDVHPGSTTELAVVGQRVEQRSNGPVISVDVEFRSDRATMAAVRLIDPVGVADPDTLDPLDVKVVDGIGSGTLVFEAMEDATLVGGVLVADTEGFNTPAVAFEFDRSLAASSGSLTGAALSLLAAAMAFVAVMALRPIGAERRLVFPVVAVVALLALPAFTLVQVLSGETLSDSGGAWWVVGLYVLLGVWAVVFFVPALSGSVRSPDPHGRWFVALAAVVTLGLGAVIGAMSGNPVLAIIIIYPLLGFITTWLARPDSRRRIPLLDQ